MELAEAALVLAKIAAYDRRTTGRADDEAWAEALTLADVGLKAALEAVTRHYVSSRDWIMPADVVRLVNEQRKLRLREVGYPDLPDGLPRQVEHAWRKAWLREIGDGATAEDAYARADAEFGITRTREIEPRHYPELVD